MHPRQHHTSPPAAIRAGTQPDRKRLGLPARQQTRHLHLRQLRPHRREVLRRVELLRRRQRDRSKHNLTRIRKKRHSIRPLVSVIHRRTDTLLGPGGTGKTHVAPGLGLAACQKGRKVRFITAASLVHELIEAVDERRLQRFQKQLTSQNLLIIDELGFVPLSKTGAELLFEVISQCYERGSIIITSNLPFDEWTEIFGSERLTGALLDRLTHHVHILEMNGDSFRLKQSRNARA